ncbi:hypothetical protein PQ455_17845 [Sphingomonas naphthae]|uniref:DUF3828 domain-containing protein n=1 Tax=Sphingomonas naphthae TaxID=1813468 RepID=A0ABY7TJP0_9SPHN|nr:hypothetical protein [Sphingomonas naphthae]WCT73443.1 hypothetical protein PQ455_17845 [Sphingomonas naphthae]
MSGSAVRLVAIGAALVVAGPAEAVDNTLPGACAFVAHLYTILPAAGRDMTPYAPPLRALMARDAAYSETSGDVGALDAMPLCDCQDMAADYRVTTLRATAPARNRATVVVSLRNGGIRRFRLDLSWGGKEWLVEDIHGPTIPSLLAHLTREVPAEEARLRQQSKRRTS